MKVIKKYALSAVLILVVGFFLIFYLYKNNHLSIPSLGICPLGYFSAMEIRPTDTKLVCLKKNMSEPKIVDVSECLNKKEKVTKENPPYFKPVVFSSEDSTSTEKISVADECISHFMLDKPESIDSCNLVKSNSEKYHCRELASVRLGDMRNCTLEFLGSKGKVNNCIQNVAFMRKDKTLCAFSLPYTSENERPVYSFGGTSVENCKSFYEDKLYYINQSNVSK